MTATYDQIFRNRCRPLEPIPTGEPEVLASMPEVRAVLFDLYGTMFISASGDVGVAQESGRPEALAEAFRAAGFRGRIEAGRAVECLLGTIRSHHEASRRRGIEYPEVDIVEVWRDVLDQLSRSGWIDSGAGELDLRRLAVEYEVRTNPTWPMPGLQTCLEQLRARGLLLGIVSNAQFYTLAMFRGLLRADPEVLGFDRTLQIYSYRYGRAKPDRFLFEVAIKALAKHAVPAEKIIYIGNDMLNDVWAARNVGFRTALFAGDRRSLRWRRADERVRGITPDVVLTELESLVTCLSRPPTRPSG